MYVIFFKDIRVFVDATARPYNVSLDVMDVKDVTDAIYKALNCHDIIAGTIRIHLQWFQSLAKMGSRIWLIRFHGYFLTHHKNLRQDKLNAYYDGREYIY